VCRALWRAVQTRNYDPERGQCLPRAVCFALLEIVTALAHGIGDMGGQSTRTPAE
jgi:hypothetical protein